MGLFVYFCVFTCFYQFCFGLWSKFWSHHAKAGKNTEIKKQSDVKFWLSLRKYGPVSCLLNCMAHHFLPEICQEKKKLYVLITNKNTLWLLKLAKKWSATYSYFEYLWYMAFTSIVTRIEETRKTSIFNFIIACQNLKCL